MQMRILTLHPSLRFVAIIASAPWIGIGAPASAQSASPSETAWHDSSPHQIGFAGPAKRRVQFLDWGGHGPTLVLIHGWNSNAHVFDGLAPRLTDRFHVVGLTLPGFGASDPPGPGYALDTAVDAIVDALDSLGITRAIFAGHSFGGWILTRMAIRHPARVDRLIYLDAAFNLAASDRNVAARPVARPSTDGLRTRADVIEWLHRAFFGFWTSALEAEYRGRSPDEDQRAALLKSISADAEQAPEEWDQIQVPVLAICALADVPSEFPWLTRGDSAYGVSRRYVEAVRRPFQHAECERFHRTVPNAQTLEIAGHHYIFEAKPDEVTRAIRAFLLGR